MSEITLDHLKTEHTKFSELIAKFEAQARTIVIPTTSIERRPGENYAGLMLDVNGELSHHLIDMGEAFEAEADWDEQMARAKAAGYDLPTPEEQSLLFANLRAKFKPRYYWSNKPYDSASAYCQNFGGGDQYYDARGSKFLARFVRRLPI